MAKRLILLNALAIVAAVVHHAINWDLTAMIWWADRYTSASVPDLSQVGSLRFYVLRLVDQFAVTGILAFLFISGRFVSMAGSQSQPRLWWKAILARLKYLLPPYLLWSTIWLIYYLAQGVEYTPLQVVRQFLEGGVIGPYYYVPLLMQLYLVSPLLGNWARNRPISLLAASALLQMAVMAVRYTLLLGGEDVLAAPVRAVANWNLPAYSFWYMLGMVTALHAQAFKQWLGRAKPWLGWATALFYVGGIVESEWLRQAAGRTWISPQVTLMDSVFFTLFLLLLLSLDKLNLPKAFDAGRLSLKSYGVYLLHVPILEVTARLLYHVAPWLLAYQLPLMLILVAVGLGLPLLLMTLVERTALKKYYVYMFG
jgi:surface polysaccharide O-acyltransferase-like enzyme